MYERMATTELFNVKLVFRNFEGRGSQYNRPGFRNVGLLLREDQASAVAALGWKVGRTTSDPDGKTDPFVMVNITEHNLPDIVVKGGQKRTYFKLDRYAELDKMEIHSANVVLDAYKWGLGNREGVKVYLKSAEIIKLTPGLKKEVGS